MWRLTLRGFLLLLVVLLGAGAWLVGTESGARIAVANISGLVPNFKARHASGTLIGPLQLRTLVIKTKKVRIKADNLLIDWSPGCLLIAELCIRDARIGKLTVELPAPVTPTSVTQTLKLPPIVLPLDIDIGHLDIGTLDIARGEKHTLYTDVAAVFAWQDSEMRIERFDIGMPGWQARVVGALATHGDWPLTATLTLQVPRAGAATFALKGTATGSLADTQLQLDSSGLIVARIAGQVAPMRSGMPFEATLNATRFLVPPHGDPEKSALVENIALRAHGELLGELAIDGQARIDTPWTPPFAATLTSAGTWRGLDQLTIGIDDPRLVARINSDYRWLGGQHFKAAVEVRKLDLSLVNPALPSRLAGTLQMNGSIEQGSTVIAIHVDTLAGTLRQWPLDARGKLRWQDAQWHFDDFLLRQGDNRMTLNGTLGNAWNADATLALGDIHTLQNAFAGTATGRAHLTGQPTDPAFLFVLDAQALLLPAITLPAPVAGMASRVVRLPAADWRLAGTATLRDVTLSDAHTVASTATPGAFGAQSHGTVSWGDRLRWDLAANFAALSLHSLLPELAGQVDGPFATRGVLGDTLELLAVDTRLAGTLDGAPLLIDTGFTRTPARLDINHLTLAHGDNHLALHGTLDAERNRVALDINAPALEKSFRAFSGAVRINANIDGARTKPDVDISATASALQYQQGALAIGMQAVDSKLHLVAGGQGASSWALAGRGLHYGTDIVQTIDLAIDGTRASHRIDFAIDAAPPGMAPLGAHLQLTGALRAGNPSAPTWEGVLREGDATINRWHWRAVGEPAIAFHDNVFDVAPHCWSDSAARACLTAPATFGRSGHAQGEVFHLPLAALLGDLLPLDTLIDGHIGGLFSSRWQDGELIALDANLRNAEPLRVALAGDIIAEQRVIGHVETLSFAAHADADGMTLAGLLDGADSGVIDAKINISPLRQIAAGQSKLAGSLHITGLQIGLIEAFTYQLHDIAGTLDGALTLAGSLAKPHVSGTLGVHAGRLSFTRLPLSLVDLNIDGHFNGDHITFDGGFRTQETGNAAKIAGTVDLNGGDWHGSGTLTGSDLLVAALPEYQFTATPELALEANATRIAVTGNVQVPTGRIELKSLPLQSVRRSHDVIVVRHQQVIQEGGLGFKAFVDVDFLLGDDIRFRAFGGEGHLTGDLRVRSSPELPLRVFGELHVKDGKYSALGQSLALKNADIIFNGPADQPLIDALAVRQIDDAAVREVGLRLTGSLRAPQTTLYSAPVLPDEQILAWLTTGRPLSEGPLNLRGDAAQAAMSLGVAQGSALLTAAGQEIGLHDVQLATTGLGDTAEVQVGTNLNERLFVGFNQRVFTGDESVLVRLKLTRRVMLEALSGLESALDIFYTFEF